MLTARVGRWMALTNNFINGGDGTAPGCRFPFEEIERYVERRKRDRCDRAMLLRCLSGLGISVEDDAYGETTLHQLQVRWGSREVTLEEARADFTR